VRCSQAHRKHRKTGRGFKHILGISIAPKSDRSHARPTGLARVALKTARREKKNQRAAAATDIARRAPGHPRTHRSTTATAMPALQKMDLQRKAA
jgi:hypothetical protein